MLIMIKALFFLKIKNKMRKKNKTDILKYSLNQFFFLLISFIIFIIYKIHQQKHTQFLHFISISKFQSYYLTLVQIITFIRLIINIIYDLALKKIFFITFLYFELIDWTLAFQIILLLFKQTFIIYLSGRDLTNKMTKIQRKVNGDIMSHKKQQGKDYLREISFDPEDQTLTFYRIIQKAGSRSCLIRHGYKIFQVRTEQESITKFCLSLLQPQASFPIKIVTTNKPNILNYQDGNKTSQKSLWVQTHFFMSSSTHLQKQHRKQQRFELIVYQFFINQLVPMLRKFKQKQIDWQSMTDEDFQYCDQSIIQKFQNQIIQNLNQKFCKFINTQNNQEL